MPTVWRQGDQIAPEDALALGLLSADEAATHRLVVVSHSCDVASDEEVEPLVELLKAEVVTEQLARCRNGHSIRKLHLPAEANQEVEWLELAIARRTSVPKADLLARQPYGGKRIESGHRNTLRRWLAQRYSRSEFPDAFVEWLDVSGVGKRFERWAGRHSGALVGIYLDLDDDSERDNPQDPYTLYIVLVYATADAANADIAQRAADELKQIFQERCHNGTGWQWLELVGCDPVSDEVFSLRAANTYRRWRFEHRSLSGEPEDKS